MSTRIIERNCLAGYEEDMQRYGLYILRYRVIPSGKDGLKLVHRRIIYDMFEFKKAIGHRIKSASIVGSILEIMHPHGDTSVYDAMKKMTNTFDINVPLLDGQGNWGTIEGDRSAAMRYTETKLSQFSLDCVIGELKNSKQAVDWIDTYAKLYKEPEYLPIAVPLLLINGVFGIAVGMRCYVPNHNLNDVIDATIKLIENPDIQITLIPDQCTECEIIEADWKTISNTGRGNFIVRGIIDIAEYEGKPAVIIRSTPDLVNLISIREKIKKFIEGKKLPQIHDIIEAGKGEIMEDIIVLKKGSDPNYVRDFLYKQTDLQKTHTVNLEVLDGTEPLRLSYKGYLQYFIEFRKTVKFRMYCNMLQTVRTKMHEMDTYIRVLQSGEVDNIINMIKNQTEINDNKIIEYLIRTLNITDMQAAFIINTNIKKLSMGYLNKYIEEFNALQAKEYEHLQKITNEDLIVAEIIEELKEIKKKYGKKRNCKIVPASILSNIPQGEFKIVITQNNYIKKLSPNDSIRNLKNDAIRTVMKVENTENILLFDDRGKVFKLPIHKVPITDRSSNGTDIRTLIKNLTANINTIMYEPKLIELSKKKVKFFLVTLTAAGNIKKMDLEDFLTVPPSGIIYAKIDQEDVIRTINIVVDKSDLIAYSNNVALRMNLDEIPHLKRATKGVKSMSDSIVDGLAIVTPDTAGIIVITNKGYINKFDIVALPCLGRAKTGTKVIKLTKDDYIRDIFTINGNDILNIITNKGRQEINISDIEFGSSISSGNKFINTRTDNIIKCFISKNKNS